MLVFIKYIYKNKDSMVAILDFTIADKVTVIYVATTVTITTLVILAAGPKREYPDGGVN